MNAYFSGFSALCSERGIDPAELIKQAQFRPSGTAADFEFPLGGFGLTNLFQKTITDRQAARASRSKPTVPTGSILGRRWRGENANAAAESGSFSTPTRRR